jgi:hypothetical protein
MPGLGAWHTKAIPTTPTGTQLEEVKALIEGTALGDMIEIHERPLISLAGKDDLHTSFNRLVEYGIHAAPVYDEVEIESGLGGRRKVKQWVGLLDWRDFVHYVIQFLDDGDKVHSQHPLLPLAPSSSSSSLKLHPNLDSSLFVRSWGCCWQSSPLVPSPRTTPSCPSSKMPPSFLSSPVQHNIFIFSLLHIRISPNIFRIYPYMRMVCCHWLMKRCVGAGFGQQGVRRRPVVAKDDQGERILTMVSQLDVVRWLSHHHKELSPAFSNITIQHVVEVRSFFFFFFSWVHHHRHHRLLHHLMHHTTRAQKEQTDPRFSKLRQVCNVMKDTMMADVLRLLDQSNLNGVSGTHTARTAHRTHRTAHTGVG